MSQLPPAHHELLHLAETALVEGNPEFTLEAARQLLSVDPLHAGALFLEAEALRDLREPSEAEDAYRRLLQQDPDHSEAWSGMGSVLFDQGLMHDAGRCFNRAIRIRDDNPDAHYGRAMVRERRGDDHGARRDYARAWRLSDRYPMPLELTVADAGQLLGEAALQASHAAQAWIATAPVVLLDVPDVGTCDAYEPAASPAELLGHVTLPLHGPDVTPGSLTLPPAILLYRNNLARYADDRGQLVAALRDSVIAHVEMWVEEATLEL